MYIAGETLASWKPMFLAITALVAAVSAGEYDYHDGDRRCGPENPCLERVERLRMFQFDPRRTEISLDPRETQSILAAGIGRIRIERDRPFQLALRH